MSDIKLYSILLISALVYITACNVGDECKYISPGDMSHQYTRCTRRFSPGVCSTKIRPVWTFVFTIQNCTERLGCPYEPRSNRFMSYMRCMRHCQALIDLYTHILASGNNNVTMLRSVVNYTSSRREGESFSEISQYEDKDYELGEDFTLDSLNFIEVETVPSEDDNENNKFLEDVDSHDV